MQVPQAMGTNTGEVLGSVPDPMQWVHYRTGSDFYGVPSECLKITATFFLVLYGTFFTKVLCWIVFTEEPLGNHILKCIRTFV